MIHPGIQALMLTLIVCGAKSPRPGKTEGMESPAMSEATRSLRSGQYKEAARQFLDLTLQYPSWAEAHLGLGYALEKQGDHAQAVKAYERAVRLDATDVRALNNLGSILVDRGLDLSRGIRLLRRAVKIRPDFALAWDNLGWAEYRRKNYGQALTFFRRALEKDPRCVPAQFHLGLYYLRREDLALARLQFRAVLQAEPSHQRAMVSLGLTLQKEGKKQEAYETYVKALEQIPPNAAMAQEVRRMIRELGPLYASGLLSGRGPSLMEQYSGEKGVKRRGLTGGPGSGRITPATEGAFTSPLDGPGRRAPSPARPGQDAWDMLERGSAPASLARPRDDGPTSEANLKQELVDRHAKYSRLYAEAGLPKDAVSEAQTVINLAPWSPAAAQAKDLVKALEGKDEPTPIERIVGLTRLGEKFALENDLGGAILQFEKVLLVDPQHAVAFKNLAYLNVVAGKNEVGLSHAKKALEIEPEYQEAWLVKGYVEAKERRFKESYESFKRLKEISKPGTQVHSYAVEMLKRVTRFVELQ